MAIRPLPTGDGRSREPDLLGTSLDRVLRHLGAPVAETVNGVFSRWDEVVGTRIAAHARPVAVRGGTLIVAVTDPAWASELAWLGDELAARARDVLGDDSIVRIDVKVRPTGGSSPAD
jgi:predicted nucleic acid-binding Zn ribbon protein